MYCKIRLNTNVGFSPSLSSNLNWCFPPGTVEISRRSPILVVGWTTHLTKYARQSRSFPQGFEMKFEQNWNHHLVFHLRIIGTLAYKQTPHPLAKSIPRPEVEGRCLGIQGFDQFGWPSDGIRKRNKLVDIIKLLDLDYICWTWIRVFLFFCCLFSDLWTRFMHKEWHLLRIRLNHQSLWSFYAQTCHKIPTQFHGTS